MIIPYQCPTCKTIARENELKSCACDKGRDSIKAPPPPLPEKERNNV